MVQDALAAQAGEAQPGIAQPPCVGELREENKRLSADRSRLEGEVRRLAAEIAGRTRTDDDVVRLKKENDLYKRKTRIVRDHVERMLSRFQTLEE